MFQVTKNRVLDELRASERRPRALVCIDDVPPLEVVDAPMERLETIDGLWRAVENLNVDLKMALLLRDIVGLSYTEIADSLEITLATVKWRIYKAREEVQLAWVARASPSRSSKARVGSRQRRGLRTRSKRSTVPQGRAERRLRRVVVLKRVQIPKDGRSARASGSPASRISALGLLDFVLRPGGTMPCPRRGRSSHAARRSPSLGWPTGRG